MYIVQKSEARVPSGHTGVRPKAALSTESGIMALKVSQPDLATDFSGDLPTYPGDLRRYWHPIATSDEVTTEPKSFVLLEEPLVAYRVNGRAVVFKDLCIHRGTALSFGSVTRDGNLRCAYHGWEYDDAGKCVRIPAKPDGSPIPGKARAIAYQVEERFGLVWVALDDPVYGIPPSPNGEYEDPNWRSFFAFSQKWDTSAGRVLENFCD